jgi:predicted ArsR family transcriptional regulator
MRGVDVGSLSLKRREILFCLAELDDRDSATARDVYRRTSRPSVSYNAVRLYLPDLAKSELVDRVGRLDRKTGGRHPIGYRITETGRQQLVDLVSHRAEQVRQDDTAVEVLEQHQTASDRVLDDPFCPGCGSVHAGDGYCPDCREERQQVEQDVIA